MKPIPDINFIKRYGAEIIEEGSCIYEYEDTLQNLIKKVENENRAIIFKNQLLAIIQLYFDGLIDSEEKDENAWPKRKEILDKLYLAGRKSIGSFYRGEGIGFDEVRDIFLPYSSLIIRYGSKKRAKSRHLTNEGSNLQNFGLELQDFFENKRIDNIICIASGGFEPSFLAMDILEKKSLVSLRYSIVARRDKYVKIPKMVREDYINKKIEDKRILVIDDWISGGETIFGVVKYIKENKPQEIYGMVAKSYYIAVPPSNIKILVDKFFTMIFKDVEI